MVGLGLLLAAPLFAQTPAPLIDPSQWVLQWDLNLDDMQPSLECSGSDPVVCVTKPITPSEEAAEALTYRVHLIGVNGTVVNLPPYTHAVGITCSAMARFCQTQQHLDELNPQLATHVGQWTMTITREGLPVFSESAPSNEIAYFSTDPQAPPAPNVDCVLSAFSAWSQVDATHEHRTRTVVTAPSGTGMACGPLEEVRMITPPAGFCRYIKPGETVVQTLAIGTHVKGTNQIATQATRWPILLGWGFAINADPRTPQPGVTVLIDAVCVGLQ